MLLSCAVILLSGLALGWLFKKIKLPSIIGMIVAGILVSPNLLNLVDNSLLQISADLRQIALVIILISSFA
jgi:Kef-type K+ transport system membrane component KefB